MALAKRFNTALHLCVALSTVAFATADGRPLLAALTIAATGACWVLGRSRPSSPPSLPRLAINTLVLAAIVNAALSAGAGPSAGGAGGSVVSTLGQFLVFIVLIKLLDRRAPRDDAQLITLTVFVAIAAMLTSAELLVGALLIAFIPTAVATAMLWQVRAGQIMLARQSAGEEVEPAAGRHPRRGFAALCASSLVAACTLATVIFVVVPRVGGEFLGRFGVAAQHKIGFKEAVKLGEAGLLSEDPTPVLDLQVLGPGGENIGSSLVMQYLRGAARDRYSTENRVWQESSSRAHNAQRIPGGSAWIPPWDRRAAIDGGSARYVEQRITMRGDGLNVFFLWRPTEVRPDRTVDLNFAPETGTVRLAQAPGPRFAYSVRSVSGDDPPPRVLARRRRTPDLDATGFEAGPVRDYTDALLERTPTSAEVPMRQVVTRIRDHLQQSFTYTTEMVAPPEGRHPIEFFLLERKAGHCEYFASAMAAMCQSQGIPARVVTGYVATEYNSLTGQYLVRQSNAHAWVEVYIFSEGETPADIRGRWERFDPSPPGDIARIHQPMSGLLARVRGWYDALEFGWSSSFVGFESLGKTTRRGGLGTPEDYTQPVARWADRLVAWGKTMAADPAKIPWWLRWSPLIGAVLVGLGIVLDRTVRRRRPRARSTVARDLGYVPARPTGFYAKALRALARAGWAKPDAVPPERFAADLHHTAPLAADSLRRVVELHYRMQFGGSTLTAAEAEEGTRRVRELAGALRRSPRR